MNNTTLRQNDANNRFTGKNGYKKKVNCAVAIAQAYQEIYPLDAKTIESYKKFGHGKAPGKLCGAYYAGAQLLENHQPQKLEQFTQIFKNEAKILTCREIRKGKTLSCQDCVLVAAQGLETIIQEKKHVSVS